jgi:hypothetical protein
MAHFAHYVKRDVLLVDYQSPEPPWFAEHQPEDQGFVAPSYHVTRTTTGPAARVSKGDTLWLLSQMRTPWGVLPPALDAKIIVAEVLDLRVGRRPNEPAFRFTAGTGSLWFPLYDASDTLLALTTINAHGTTGKPLALPNQSLGRSLQSIREVADATPLVALERKLAGRFDFVSYRLLDGTRSAFDAVRQLLQFGEAVWWDRWSLPRRLAERREFADDSALNNFILGRIEASNTVHGIASPKYADPDSYSRKEMELALKLGKFHQWLDEQVKSHRK